MSARAPRSKPDLRGLPRFLVAVVLVALLYVGLQEFWLAITGAVLKQHFAPDWLLAGNVQREAQRIAAESQSKEAVLSPTYRRAAFELGYNVGYIAAVRGGALTWSDAARTQLGQMLASQEEAVRRLSGFLGTGDVRPLRVSDPAENLRLPQAIEADENELSSRVERATTPRHRQLYLLGAHTGVAAAQVDLAVILGGGTWPIPPLQIARHAVLAGVPRLLWEPLQQVPAGKDAKQIAETYHRSIAKLDEALGDPATINSTATR